MSAPRLLQILWPPLRRPLPARAWLTPLLLTGVLLGAAALLPMLDVCWWERPGALALLLLLPWFWRMLVAGHAGLSGFRGKLALMLRVILLALLTGALAQPRAVRSDEGLAVLYALDVSASISNSMADAAMAYVTRTVGEKPPADEAGLVVFGGDSAVELPPAASFPLEFEAAINARVNRESTDIASALRLTAAVLPQDKAARIVLISDGTQTQGDLQPVLEELRARQVAVDVLPINYDHDHEVWVERLELPRHVRVGETYEAVVLVNTLAKGSGELLLRENGQVVFRDQVQYEAGKNRYALPIRLRDAGMYEYEALLTPDGDQDGWQRNNRAGAYLQLQGEGRVLVVTDPAGEKRDYESLVRAMQSAQRTVDVMDAYSVPTDSLSLLPYDCIFFVNAPADSFALTQLQAVHDAVFHQGSGFVMVGGENSFGPGGYHRTVVEDMLPVSMDVTQRKIMPKAAMAIILHTCEFAEGNTWAKRITKQAVKVLGSEDDVGVLAYQWQGGDSWVFPLTPAGRYDELAVKINNAQIGDMPSFIPTMQQALAALKANDAMSKHMIIISDGDPQPPSPALLQEFADAKISISTVAVFPHGGNETQSMQLIAKATGGRYYFVNQDANALPAIFIKEAKTLKRSMIQNKTFVPTQRFPSPILKGIDGSPPLRGYVLTTPKPRGLLVLDGPEDAEDDPILSVWRYGVGKTAAFTSDLAPNWAADWMMWDKYGPFIKQLLVDVSRAADRSDLRLQSQAIGGKGQIVVEDYARAARFLQVTAQVLGPNQQQRTIKLEQTGPRRYEAQFDLWGEGRYVIAGIGNAAGEAVSADDNAAMQRVFGGFVVAYSPEYLRFRADPILLKDIADKTGGRVLDGTETGDKLFGVERTVRHQSRPVFDWLLIALALLLPLDVAVRRVHLDWRAMAHALGFGRRQVQSDATFDALRRAKQSTEKTLRVRSRREEPQPLRASTLPPPAAQQPASPKPAADKPAPAPGADASTTSRLLANKRRRQQDDDQPNS